jgi:ribosomal protein L11 methyltransferase
MALDRLVRSGLVARRVADIGGGTGVLAMAAASVWPAAAIAGDIDPRATATARENVAANGLAARIACVTAAGLRHPRLRRGAPYGLVFANILAGPLRRLAPDIAAAQAPGGVAILSGLLARQAPGVAAVYRSWGYMPVETVRIGDWRTLVLRRAGRLSER